MKNSYGFILVKPQLGENIGATARVLKNFGFNKLCITSPRDGWPNQKAIATSVGASNIIEKTWQPSSQFAPNGTYCWNKWKRLNNIIFKINL